ncbi:MAG: ABC transporter ATP-binding protein [Yoonia sp.]|nr:ABC transporter ATP-binding protein [Yoonia sp.]
MPPLLDRNRGRGLAAVAIFSLVQGAAAGAAAFATRGLFAAMHEGATLPVTGLVVLVAAGAFIAVTRVAARQWGERIGQDYAREIRRALFTHAAHMPARAVAQRRSGYMSLRFVGDMGAFRNWLGRGLPTLVSGVVLVPVTLMVLWLLSPAFAFVVAPVLGLTLVLITLGGLRLVPLQRRLRVRRARIAADMAERMPLAPYLDRLGRRGKELAQLDRRTDAMISAALQHRCNAETIKALPDVAVGIAAALVVLAGVRAGLDTGRVAAALAALGLLVSPLRDLGSVWNDRAAYRAAVVKANAVLIRPGRRLYRKGKSFPKGVIDVVFRDVLLPSGHVLNATVAPRSNFCLSLGEWDAEAVMDMLLGLDAPAEGQILLSGVDLCDLSQGSLRRGVLRVGATQEILQGSLRRVLLLGVTDRPDDAALDVLAREGGLGALLDRLGGLDGTVWEGGRNLTRRERQCISLVRMRLFRPRLILVGSDCDLSQSPQFRRYVKRRGATVIRASELVQAMPSAA